MSGRISTGAKIIRSIVKNDAVKTDPPEIYGWRAFAMAGSACFGGMLFGFDIGTIGGVLELNEFQMYATCQHRICHCNVADTISASTISRREPSSSEPTSAPTLPRLYRPDVSSGVSSVPGWPTSMAASLLSSLLVSSP
jgi:hypothetical protein